MELTSGQIHTGFKNLAKFNVVSLKEACKNININEKIYIPVGADKFIERNMEAIKDAFKLLNDKEYVKKNLEY